MMAPGCILSVVIPVYNESRTICELLERVKQSLQRQKINAEIIVVNDGSKDDSAAVIRTIPDIVFIDLKDNQGKGGAVKAGFRAAKGDILIIQDADLEYDPDDYTAMIAPILAGQTQVTMGSRFLREKPIFWGQDGSPYFTHYIGNKLIIWLTNCLYWNSATDYEGCYKAFARSLINLIPIRSNGFEYDNELICKILKRGIKIAEVPIRYTPRLYNEGKKITWKHGVKMLWTILRYRFGD